MRIRDFGRIGLWLLACGAAGYASAQTGWETAARPDPRRTPVVEVFQRWRNSVVYLTGATLQGDGPSIEEFFRVPEKDRKVISIGSGFVVHHSGYIVTSAHAVEKVIAHLVTFSNQTAYRAELIGFERDYDLALLKIAPKHRLVPVQLAAGGDLLIGETVIVISNPHGLMHTCTTGVLSATHRATRPQQRQDFVLDGLLQTDAGINPGSSGGPWFNVLGQVIGITTAVRPESQRIGFAVSVETIRKVLPGLLDVERRYGFATGLKVNAAEPCRVMSVAAISPAARAGLRAGDVLVRLAEAPLASGADLHLALVGSQAGQKLPFRVLRNGKLHQGSLQLDPRVKPDGAALLKRKLGLTAVPLDEAKARATGLRFERGVVIAAVDRGLYGKLDNPPRPGDVLARIGQVHPRDLDHLGLLLERLETGHPVRVVLLRLKGNVGTRVDLTIPVR